nr:MAG TPA: Mediator complex subunit 25 PTOV activation and synapsin 2 [Caudoviricetes sp.]
MKNTTIRYSHGFSGCIHINSPLSISFVLRVLFFASFSTVFLNY